MNEHSTNVTLKGHDETHHVSFGGVHSTKAQRSRWTDPHLSISWGGRWPLTKQPASNTHKQQTKTLPFLLLLYLDIKLERLAGEEPNGDIASSRRQERSNERMGRSGEGGCRSTSTAGGGGSWRCRWRVERGLRPAVCSSNIVILWNGCIIASWMAAIRRKGSAAAAGRWRIRMKGRWTWQRRMKMIGSAGIAVQVLQTVAIGRGWTSLNGGSSSSRDRWYGNRRWIGYGCLGGGGT